MAKSPAQFLRTRYQQARTVVRKEEQRELTQREFLDVAIGNNPRTGKPYNTRTLRKWLGGERKADRVIERAQAGGGIIQQSVVDETGNRYSVTVANPVGRSRLDLYTPTRRRDIKRAVKQHADERIAQAAQPGGTPAPDYWKRIGKRPRLAGARSVKQAKQITIIRARKPKSKAA